jgi:hypothetical protein
MTKKKVKRQEDSPFWVNLKRFVDHTESLEKTLVLVDLMARVRNLESKRVQDFIDKKGKSVKKKKGSTFFTVSPENYEEYSELVRQRNNSRIACKTLPRSLFVSAVSQFDMLIGSLVKTILDLQPNIISPEKVLTFADIKGFKTIKEAVDHLVDREIEALLFDSHSAHLEWLGKKTRIDILSKLSSELPAFIELTERRNLFVHADGIVNTHYLAQCKANGIVLQKDCKKGFELTMDPVYFKASVACLYGIAVKLSFLLWRQFKAAEIEKADEFFNNDIAVHLIKRKKYKLAENLLAFAEVEFTESTDEMHKVMFINLALSIKLDGRVEEAKNLVNTKDWSACSDDLQLGVAALKDDYKEAFRLMQKIGKESKFISEFSYIDDPIFENLRQQKGFDRVFKKIYGRKPMSRREEEKENKISKSNS